MNKTDNQQMPENKLKELFPELAGGMLAHCVKHDLGPDEDGSEMIGYVMPLGWVVEWMKIVQASTREQAERRWVGIVDRKGNKVFEGDIVGLPYIPPFGGVGMDDELVYKAKVVFKHATYMLEMIDYDSYTENVEVIDWLVKKEGEYVPNYGNKKIIEDRAYFEVLQSPTQGKEE